MKKIKLNLAISQSKHDSDIEILSALAVPEIVRINQKPKNFAKQVYDAIHKEILKQGKYDTLLNYILPEDLKEDKIVVKLDKHKGHLYPEIDLKYDLFYFQNEFKQWMGVVPALEIEASGKTEDDLKENVAENIRLEFMRKNRLQSITSLLMTQWRSDWKIEQVPLEFTFYTLSELERIEEQTKEELMPKIADIISIPNRELFGLEKEFEQLSTALQGKNRNSVLVIAGAGRGKSALLREFCRQKDDLGLKKVRIWEVSAAQLLHRLSGMGGWEEYLGQMCTELRKSGDILYVTNFGELFEVGQYIGNSMSMGDYLRDYISRGDILIITECTPEQAAQIDLRSPGYLSLFTNIKIEDLTQDDILNIVNQKINQIAELKNTAIEEDAIQEILRLQQWYTPYSELPGKTIHFLSGIIADKQQDDLKIIDKDAIFKRFCQETGMPEFMVNPNIQLNVNEMRAFFHKNIYGQKDAIETVLDLIMSIKAAVIRREKPLASLLFVGPTGVGKTELAKVLAQFMFGNRDKMIRFDMSEYRDISALMRLTGDSTGGEGLLTSLVRQEPFSVILFDELEKVNPSFYDLLLQVLGEGRLTDARGRVADFSSTIIIMTSNIGARSFQTGTIGFVETLDQKEAAVEHFVSEVQAHFRPELFNRLDQVIPFAPLEQTIVRKIIDREIKLVYKREGIRGRNIDLQITKDVLDLLAEKGYDARYGARFLQRAVQELLIIPLSQNLNLYEFDIPLEVKVYLMPEKEEGKEEKITFDIKIRDDVNVFEKVIYKKKKEELTVSEFVKQVTEFRRQAGCIENGSYYAKFLSRFDQLERKLQKFKRQKKESKFWKAQTQQREYFELQKLQQDFQNAFQEVQELEADNFLVLNGLKEASRELHTRFESWKKEFSRLKASMVRYENPEFFLTVVAIYANPSILYDVSKLYTSFARKNNIKAEAFSVWYNHKKTDENKYEREAYGKYNVPEHYRLCGVEIQFSGELSYLYVKGEDGLHDWTDYSGTQQPAVIATQTGILEDYVTPEGVFRQNFFDNFSSRRTYYERGVNDSNYNIYENYTSKTMTHSLMLHNMLQTQFDQHVDEYLFG